MPLVVSRVGSSARIRCASILLVSIPRGVAVSEISLPIEYMITEGWLWALATRASMSRSHHCSNSSL